jgi:cell division GTPase FtsZ
MVDTVFIGVGQGGSNIVRELEKEGFNAFYINTSLMDLDCIETDGKNKYHIDGMKGMAKNRQYAIEVITQGDNIDKICRKVYERYANATIYYFVYTLSGGTGGSFGGILAEAFGDLFGEEGKVSNVVAVLPKSNEDLGMQGNAIQSLEQLKDAYNNGNGFITNIQLLDNNSRENKMDINKDFAITMSRLLNYDHITTEGNLDENEMEVLLTTRGFMTILEFANDDFGNGLSDAVGKSIYVEPLKDPKLDGMILNKKHKKDINIELIRDLFGYPTYTHDSVWNEETNIIISSGTSFNNKIVTELKKSYKELMDKKNKAEEESASNIEEDIEIDFSAMNKVNSIRTSSNQSSSTQTSTRNRRKSSSIRDKYMNLGK